MALIWFRAMSVNGDDSNLNTARSTATVCSELSDHDSEAGISAGFGGLSNISPRSRLSASRDEGYVCLRSFCHNFRCYHNIVLVNNMMT